MRYFLRAPEAEQVLPGMGAGEEEITLAEVEQLVRRLRDPEAADILMDVARNKIGVIFLHPDGETQAGSPLIRIVPS